MVTKEEKIDKVVSDLENQVDNIKQFSKMLDRINELSHGIQSLSEQVVENSGKYINVTRKLDDSIVTIEQHIESVSTASESRIETIQNESLLKYKKWLEDAVRLIRESEQKIIVSNSSVNKQIEFSQNHITLAAKEVSDNLNQRLSDMGNDQLEAQAKLTELNIVNNKILMKVIIGSTVLICALITTGYFL